MPRLSSGGKKPRDRHYKRWSETQLSIAAKDVAKGRFTLRKAAEMYNVPKSTLWDRVSGNVSFGAHSGPPRYLNDIEEEELVTFLVGSAKIGFAQTKEQVLCIVRAALAKKHQCEVEDVNVTTGWWGSFVKRHPKLRLRYGSKLAYRRVIAANPDVINRYFDLLEETLKSNNLLESPMLIFNCDESGFPLQHKPGKIIGVQGQRDISCITSGDKAQITVLSACSASGYLLPPMIIFDRKKLKPNFTTGEIPGTAYGLSKNGWIDSELFQEWFTNHFLLHIPPQRPILLLLDGHSSHYQPQLIRTAAANQIILFCLPPHTTHLCQLLDRSCFSPLKKAYNNECHLYMSYNPGKAVNRFNFTEIFSRAWTKAMTPANIVAGFRSTGIYPFNRYAVLRYLQLEEDGKIDMIASKMGLFLPLYSPAKSHPRTCITSDSESIDYYEEHTCSEDSTCGYYGNFSADEDCITKVQPSTLHDFLTLPQLPSNEKKNHSARVLTSSENLQLIREKEMKKADELKAKDLRKQQREKKAMEREQKKKEVEERKNKRAVEKAEKERQKKETKQSEQSTSKFDFTEEEHSRFSRRYENGYDLPDIRYEKWKKIFHPEELSLDATACKSSDGDISLSEVDENKSALEQSPKSSQISRRKRCTRSTSKRSEEIELSEYDKNGLSDNETTLEQSKTLPKNSQISKRKRCTRSTSKRGEEEIGLSEYDKSGLSDNETTLEQSKTLPKNSQISRRKRCTRSTSKRGEEEIGLSEYDKNGLSDNETTLEQSKTLPKNSQISRRKRCTRSTSKRGEEEIGLSEYDKNGLSDNETTLEQSKNNLTTKKLSACSNNLCFHTKATNWVECEKCFQWYHMICVGIKKEKSLNFVCFMCDIIINC